MGRTNYSVTGYGMNVEEARRDATKRDREEHGTEEGYSGGFYSSTGDDDHVQCLVKPVPPQKGVLAREPRGLPLKWETRYVATTQEFDCERQVVSKKTMGECITAAKEWVRVNNIRVILSVEKVAVQGSPRFGSIAPQKGSFGQWRFFGEARS